VVAEASSASASLIKPAISAAVASDDSKLAAIRSDRVIDAAPAASRRRRCDGQAIQYGVGVGRQGFAWAGTKTVSMKREWPDWRPPLRERDVDQTHMGERLGKVAEGSSSLGIDLLCE